MTTWQHNEIISCYKTHKVYVKIVLSYFRAKVLRFETDMWLKKVDTKYIECIWRSKGVAWTSGRRDQTAETNETKR